MGKHWTRTKEQEQYLEENYDSFLVARKAKSIPTFRIQLYEGWERRWPERGILFPAWKEEDGPLTVVQLATLRGATAKRKLQLYNAVRWHCQAKPLRTQNPRTLLDRYLRIAKKGRKQAPRKRSILEVYNDLFFESKLKALVQGELDRSPEYLSMSRNDRSARRITVYKEIRANCWDNETAEVKAQVMQAYEDQDVDNDDDQEDEDDEGGEEDQEDDEDNEKTVLRCQQECTDVIGAVVASFLKDASEATGCAFHVLVGGLSLHGDIKVATLSVGKTVSGDTFQSTHKNFQGGVIEPWIDFLHQRHPSEERLQWALLWAGLSSKETTITGKGSPVPETAGPAGDAVSATAKSSNTTSGSVPITAAAPVIDPATITEPEPTSPNTVPPSVAPKPTPPKIVPSSTAPKRTPPNIDPSSVTPTAPSSVIPTAAPSVTPTAAPSTITPNAAPAVTLTPSPFTVTSNATLPTFTPMTPLAQQHSLRSTSDFSPLSQFLADTDALYPWTFDGVDQHSSNLELTNPQPSGLGWNFNHAFPSFGGPDFPGAPGIGMYTQDIFDHNHDAINTTSATTGPFLPPTPFIDPVGTLTLPTNNTPAVTTNPVAPCASPVVPVAALARTKITATATNSAPPPGNTNKQKAQLKRRTHEQENAHCILPEGSRRDRKRCRRFEDQEQTPAVPTNQKKTKTK